MCERFCGAMCIDIDLRVFSGFIGPGTLKLMALKVANILYTYKEKCKNTFKLLLLNNEMHQKLTFSIDGELMVIESVLKSHLHLFSRV